MGLDEARRINKRARPRSQVRPVPCSAETLCVRDVKRSMQTPLLIAAAIAAASGLTWAQKSRCRQPELQREIYERQARPKLEKDYLRAVKFKVGSRKSVYRRGEMITLDFAMLNVSGGDLFLHKLSRPNISLSVRSENGATARISPYLLVLEGVTPDSYQYVAKDRFLIASFQLLVDCSSKEKFDKSLVDLKQAKAVDQAIFDKDLFTTWGDACLSIGGTGSYTITAEMSNEFVGFFFVRAFNKNCCRQNRECSADD